MVDIQEIKKFSIVDYLTKIGVEVFHRGNKSYCSSPFSNDSNPSFYIYPSNSFYDWSTGKCGDIIDLVMALEDLSLPDACDKISGGSFMVHEIVKEKTPNKIFTLQSHINVDKEQIGLIKKYAQSRGITEGFVPAKFYYMAEYWERMPAIGFIHTDYDGDVCGIKMRAIDPNYKERFTARGKLKYYVLNNIIAQDPTLYIVESESSANSLFMILKLYNINGVVVSFGGVANIPKRVPYKYEFITDRKLIIDYDGNKRLYQERLANYSHLNATPITFDLAKGEDINSLYSSGDHSNILDKITNNEQRDRSI